MKVGVFVNESLEKIVGIAETAKLDAIQLHGEETPEFARELKSKTNLEIIKAFRVSPEFKPEDVTQYEVDAILLDAYNPQEHGGTGETFDWEIAKKVQEIFPKMYLAGGLTAQNVTDAVRRVKPIILDVCSGIESEKGKKDKTKLINFVFRAKNYCKIANKIESDDFFDKLEFIQVLPKMWLRNASLSQLESFFNGFKTALKLSKSDYDTKNFFVDFDEWAVNKLIGRQQSAYGWCGIILKKFDNDEEKALEYFFALLEEFKLEKEDLHSETIQWEKASDEDFQKFEQNIENAN